ncbi:helix-turn-helix domain-containing protein [Paenibacillus ihuae]|uniref:helix-turn-helix domain-containing protein n=1 Tax=Paenibacillus ihuae TaxID=1232431 RepID=UPI0006D5A0E9
MTLVENIKSLCDSIGISIPKLEKEMGFSKGSIYNWDRSSPAIDKVKKVADYFSVPLDSILPTSDDSERSNSFSDNTRETLNLIDDRYNNRDYTVMLHDLMIRNMSYLHEGKDFRFLPQYQLRIDTELNKLNQKYKIEFRSTPDSILEICKAELNRQLTKEVLDSLKNLRNEVDSDIRFGKTPPPIPVDQIETIAAHHEGEQWTEEELEEIERFKEFVRMKRGPRTEE